MEESEHVTCTKEKRDEFFKELDAWHRNYVTGMQQISATFSMWNYMITQQAAASSANTVANRLGANRGGLTNLLEYARPARQEEIINTHGGYEYTIAPLWKRFVAEVIDTSILFVIKLMITFALVDILDLNINMDIDLFKMPVEDSYNELLNFTSELLILEIVTKILACVYEAIWTQGYPQNAVGGATPGKMLMGIRVMYVEAVILLDPPQRGALVNNNRPVKALLFPAQNLGFTRALLRASIKNIFLTILFPICFVIFLNRNNNRTIYEMLTKTVVVEDQIRPPTLRRR